MTLPPPADEPDVPALAPPPPASGQPSFPVVGLGASAGGLRALQMFFDHLPDASDMAFVVILHLSPAHESQAAALLQPHTAMPVIQVTAPLPLLPNHVYVIPPAQHLHMVDGSLRPVPATASDRRVPIDHFFRTLAETHDQRAAVVILSGTGSDGAVGLGRVKEQGGVIFVQDPQDAEWDGMPRSAIATGLVDYVLPVAAIPAYWQRAAIDRPVADTNDETLLREILALLRVRTTHDFSQYKHPTLRRRIGRRMQVTGVMELAQYLTVLRTQPAEVHALLQDLLIRVTNFFRDRDAWTALDVIIPLLFTGKGPADQVRVWVTACATGEEAYTVAMLLQEHADTLAQPPALQVFASDIDDQAIAQVRVGRYPASIGGDVSPERLRRFFVGELGGYRVKPELRDLVVFAHHNVLRDPPFSKLDLVTCRNLLIYLNREAQAYVIRLFHFSLRPGGYLLLGSAESLDGVPDLFTVVAKTQRLFQQRPVSALVLPAVPPPLRTRPPGAERASPPALPAARNDVEEQHHRLLAAYLPPSALVTADYELVHLGAGAERFVQFAAGAPSVNLLRVVHPNLRGDLRLALAEAVQQGQRSVPRRVRVTVGDAVHTVDLVVEPIDDPAWPRGALLVVFGDRGPASGAVGVPVTPDTYCASSSSVRIQNYSANERVSAVAETYGSKAGSAGAIVARTSAMAVAAAGARMRATGGSPSSVAVSSTRNGGDIGERLFQGPKQPLTLRATAVRVAARAKVNGRGASAAMQREGASVRPPVPPPARCGAAAVRPPAAAPLGAPPQLATPAPQQRAGGQARAPHGHVRGSAAPGAPHWYQSAHGRHAAGWVWRRDPSTPSSCDWHAAAASSVPCSPIARRAGESLVQYRYTRPNSRNSFYGSYSRRG